MDSEILAIQDFMLESRPEGAETPSCWYTASMLISPGDARGRVVTAFHTRALMYTPVDM